MSASLRPARAGFTLVEMVLVAGLLGLAVWVGSGTLRSGRDAFRMSNQLMSIDTDGARTMRRILEALREADDASVASIPAFPFFSESIDFQLVEPYDGTSTPLGDPRCIEIDADAAAVRWVENPGLGNESSSYWASNIATLLEGEVDNNLDDNGNGMIDEPGLYFSRDGELIRVGLTMTTQGPSGPVTRTWTGSIRCRN